MSAADHGEGDRIVVDPFTWSTSHAARHLGVVEALKGVLRIRGTATV